MMVITNTFQTLNAGLLVSGTGVERHELNTKHRWHAGHSASRNKQTRDVIKTREYFFVWTKGRMSEAPTWKN